MTDMDAINDVEIDAGDAEETWLKVAHLLRGAIITQFAHVEFMFADLYFRALQLPEYRSLPAKLPYLVRKRIARVKQLAAMDGPISAYGTELLGVADGLTEFEDLRQFMAHGHMTVQFDADPPTIAFQVYDQPKDSGPILRIMRTNHIDLGEESIRVGRYDNRVVALLYRIFTEIPLEPTTTYWSANRVTGAT